MSGTPDAQLIATPAYRQRIAECILDGVNRYKQAVTNQIPYQKPSAIVAATDPTSVPSLEKVVPNVGSTISIVPRFPRLKALESSAKEIESLKRLPSFRLLTGAVDMRAYTICVQTRASELFLTCVML